ncbi:hypothetical protein [Actinacidiphila glaucinigra]|uniref:hypothetical protein n=1 Tax=Actinacidiphila glaucinigra TaxID=235986 RepID=UPI000B790393|nr:hypothetical protein [Actinacidiphila glaucinigra]
MSEEYGEELTGRMPAAVTEEALGGDHCLVSSGLASCGLPKGAYGGGLLLLYGRHISWLTVGVDVIC